ncbi:hypothetical protein E2C01_087451 [Portunus trituberculatus]|uniref:Uncharacterized protein n=1 Tax=Portunus trituberculatus TaxID=210409 RepID=A0A5B7JCI5_PORTR|nr:hypothetical protein [Portunus trituberculatus]
MGDQIILQQCKGVLRSVPPCRSLSPIQPGHHAPKIHIFAPSTSCTSSSSTTCASCSTSSSSTASTTTTTSQEG